MTLTNQTQNFVIFYLTHKKGLQKTPFKKIINNMTL